MTGSKTCKCCGSDLPLTAYHVQKEGKFGRQAKCKRCTSDTYYKPKREEVIERTRKRRATEEGRNLERQWQSARRRANPIPRMIQEARARAKKKGIGFCITADDIALPETCPVLGIPIAMGVGERSDTSPSIDRVDSTKGYVPGNVRVISWRANRLKNDATLAELKAIAAYMESALGVAVTAAHQMREGV